MVKRQRKKESGSIPKTKKINQKNVVVRSQYLRYKNCEKKLGKLQKLVEKLQKELETLKIKFTIMEAGKAQLAQHSKQPLLTSTAQLPGKMTTQTTMGWPAPSVVPYNYGQLPPHGFYCQCQSCTHTAWQRYYGLNIMGQSQRHSNELGRPIR